MLNKASKKVVIIGYQVSILEHVLGSYTNFLGPNFSHCLAIFFLGPSHYF